MEISSIIPTSIRTSYKEHKELKAGRKEQKDIQESSRTSGMNRDWRQKITEIDIGKDGIKSEGEVAFLAQIIGMLEISEKKLTDLDFDRLLKKVKDILYQKFEEKDVLKKHTKSQLESLRKDMIDERKQDALTEIHKYEHVVKINENISLWEVELQNCVIGGNKGQKESLEKNPEYSQAKQNILAGLKKARISLSGTQFSDLFTNVNKILWKQSSDWKTNINEAQNLLSKFHSGVMYFGEKPINELDDIIRKELQKGRILLRGRKPLNEGGDYLITFEEFERTLPKKRYQDVDPLALGAYLGHLKNSKALVTTKFLSAHMNLEIIAKLGDMISGDIKDDKLASRGYKYVCGGSLHVDMKEVFSRTNKTEERKQYETTNRSAELFRNTLEQHYGILLTDFEEKKMADILLNFSRDTSAKNTGESVTRILELMNGNKYKGKNLQAKTIRQILGEALKSSDLADTQLKVFDRLLEDKKSLKSFFPNEKSEKFENLTLDNIDGETALYLITKYGNSLREENPDLFFMLNKHVGHRTVKRIMSNDELMKKISQTKDFSTDSALCSSIICLGQKENSKDLITFAKSIGGNEKLIQEAFREYQAAGGTERELREALILSQNKQKATEVKGAENGNIHGKVSSKVESIDTTFDGKKITFEEVSHLNGTKTITDPYTGERITGNDQQIAAVKQSKELFYTIKVPEMPFEFSTRILQYVKHLCPECLNADPLKKPSEQQIFRMIDTIGKCLIGDSYEKYKQERKPFTLDKALSAFGNAIEFRQMTGNSDGPGTFHGFLERVGHIKQGVFQPTILHRFEQVVKSQGKLK